MTFLCSLARQYPGSQLARVVARHLAEAEAGAEPALQPVPADTDPTPRSGERWAEVYGRALGPCGARTRAGALCRQPGVGCGGRCKFHGSNATGPKTPEGKLRSARNGSRHRMKEMSMQQPEAEVITAPDPAPPPKRVPFLERLLDEHLSGARRWPLVDNIFRAIEARVPPTRAELVAELPAPGEPIVRMLEARGMLAERAVGRRTVIVRVPAAAVSPRAGRADLVVDEAVVQS